VIIKKGPNIRGTRRSRAAISGGGKKKHQGGKRSQKNFHSGHRGGLGGEELQQRGQAPQKKRGGGKTPKKKRAVSWVGMTRDGRKKWSRAKKGEGRPKGPYRKSIKKGIGHGP